MHGRMLRQLLRLTQAVGDDQGTAKVVSGTQKRCGME